ncbi:MAG: hypothetical protein NTV46_07670 [Verrucomicrobia bacterium]|nr:hypothetical protein [Verrucomicrobiota bacterium]
MQVVFFYLSDKLLQSAAPQVQPRLLVLDPPFALVMKRKGAPKPYFVAWFANADLLGGE